MALNDAVADLQRGRIDYAMVGGSSALFRPATTVAFHQLQCARCPRMLSVPASCWAHPSMTCMLPSGSMPCGLLHHQPDTPLQ